MEKYFVFTDGSCLDVTYKEKAVGGWCYIVTDSNFNIISQDFGKLRKGFQDSARAELEGLYQALLKLKSFKRNSTFHIYSDYKAIVDTLTGFSKRNSHRDFWDLIEPLCKELEGRLTISHVYGHFKNQKEIEQIKLLNNEADKHAKAGARSLIKAPVKIA